MRLQLATKTLAAIEATMRADQGASFREWQGRVIPHLGDAFRGEEDGYRTHLGASLMGRECARELWYSFHWATKSNFEGRQLRLFNRGHLEEGRFMALLLMIGCQVYQQDEHGNQFRISDAGGHFGGSGDGVVVGLPDLPAGMPACTEFKTHNDASFKKLVAEGVRYAKFEHYVQMQIYMRKMGLGVALYCGVNKNNDDIHFELVPIEPDVGDKFIERGRKIIFMHEAPERIDAKPGKPLGSPGWMACKFCDHKPVCKLGAAPARNCRTCEHSLPRDDGTWWCMRFASTLDKATQLVGCAAYEASSRLA